jgi:hypothetical protein
VRLARWGPDIRRSRHWLPGDARGAQTRLGVTPDLAVFATARGAEFSVPRPGRHAPGMELAGNDSVLHGATFNSNLVSTSAAIDALDELSRDGGRCVRADGGSGASCNELAKVRTSADRRDVRYQLVERQLARAQVGHVRGTGGPQRAFLVQVGPSVAAVSTW